MMISVSGLHFYPIKSCAGTTVDSVQADARGFIDDRAWMVVDQDNKFVTQRERPSMALIKPDVVAEHALHLSAPGMGTLDAPAIPDGQTRTVKVWSDVCQGIDQGDAAAEWLSEFLKLKCRLVRMSDRHCRRVDSRYAPRKTDQVGFADGFPFLIISRASLEDLNRRLAEPLPMNRFRPNIVVDGCEPFAEDGWKQISIGEMRFDVVKPCARCVITTVDQATAQKGKEPLKTLNEFRNVHGKLMFGQNMIHQLPGKLNVGDRLTVLS